MWTLNPSKKLPNTYFRLAALLLTLLPWPLPLLPLSESVGDAALALEEAMEEMDEAGVGAVRGMFMRSKIESLELAGC